MRLKLISRLPEEERLERQETLDAEAFEVELFEKYELPAFILFMEARGLTPEQTLGALYDLAFTWKGGAYYGWTPMEIGRWLNGSDDYDWIRRQLPIRNMELEKCDEVSFESN